MGYIIQQSHMSADPFLKKAIYSLGKVIAVSFRRVHTPSRLSHFRKALPTLAVFALDYFNYIFLVFGPSVQVRMKTTRVCQTFHYLMGHL